MSKLLVVPVHPFVSRSLLVSCLALALSGSSTAAACDLAVRFVEPGQRKLAGGQEVVWRVKFQNVGKSRCRGTDVELLRYSGRSVRGRGVKVGGKGQRLGSLDPRASEELRFVESPAPDSGPHTYGFRYSAGKVDANTANHLTSRTVEYQSTKSRSSARGREDAKATAQSARSKVASPESFSGSDAPQSLKKTNRSRALAERSVASAAGKESLTRKKAAGARAQGCQLVARFASPEGEELVGGERREWEVEFRNVGRGRCPATTVSLARFTGRSQTGSPSTVGGSGARRKLASLGPGEREEIRVRERRTPDAGIFTYALRYRPVVDDGQASNHEISKQIRYTGSSSSARDATRRSELADKVRSRRLSDEKAGDPAPSDKLSEARRRTRTKASDLPEALRNRSVAPPLGRVREAASRIRGLDAIVLLRFQGEGPPAEISMSSTSRPCFRWELQRSIPSGEGGLSGPQTGVSPIESEARLTVTELTMPQGGTPLALGWELPGGPRQIRVRHRNGVLQKIPENRMVIPQLCVAQAIQRGTGSYGIRLTVEDDDLGRSFDRNVTVRVRTGLNPTGRPPSGADPGEPPPPPPPPPPANDATAIQALTVPDFPGGTTGTGTVTLDGRLAVGMELRICRDVGHNAVQIDNCPYGDVGEEQIAQGPAPGPAFSFGIPTDAIAGTSTFPIKLVATLRRGTTNLDQEDVVFDLQPQGATPPPPPQAASFSSQLYGRFRNAKCVNCHAIPDRQGAYGTHMSGSNRRWSDLPANPSDTQLMAYVTNASNCTLSGCHPVGGSPWSGNTFPSIWHSPPASMAWGSAVSADGLCSQIKQHKSTPQAMYDHLFTNDPLVEWAIRKMGVGFATTWKDEVEAWVGSPSGGWLDMPCP